MTEDEEYLERMGRIYHDECRHKEDNRPEHVKWFDDNGDYNLKIFFYEINDSVNIETLFQMFKARLLSETGYKDDK